MSPENRPWPGSPPPGKAGACAKGWFEPATTFERGCASIGAPTFGASRRVWCGAEALPMVFPRGTFDPETPPETPPGGVTTRAEGAPPGTPPEGGTGGAAIVCDHCGSHDDAPPLRSELLKDDHSCCCWCWCCECCCWCCWCCWCCCDCGIGGGGWNPGGNRAAAPGPPGPPPPPPAPFPFSSCAIFSACS